MMMPSVVCSSWPVVETVPEPVEGPACGFDASTGLSASKLSHRPVVETVPEPVEGPACGFDKLSHRPVVETVPEPVEGTACGFDASSRLSVSTLRNRFAQPPVFHG